MTTWLNRSVFLSVSSLVAAGGCATAPTMSAARIEPPLSIGDVAKATPIANAPGVVVRAAAEESAPKQDAPLPIPADASARVRPAYAELETLPIDLPTVMRLVDANSPAVGIARARVREAQARLANAEVQWLPNLSVGVVYNRFDGQTQNQRGDIFGLSRANLYGGGGPALSIDFADAIYRPLVERRLNAAEQLRERATSLNADLESVSAYLNLVEVYALLEINADALQKTEAMLVAARNAKEAKLDRTAGDVNRSQTEVLLRRTERIELQGRAGVASARLGRLLLLAPNVKLVPADAVVAPLSLIDPTATVDQLVAIAIANRPDLAANREVIAAAWAKVRRAERGPLLPKLTVANTTGGYGGGLNDDLQNFDSRNALSVQLYWEVKNFGFGNRADAAERRALLDQAHFQLVEAQAKAAADIVEAAQIAGAGYETLDLAERAVREATELYRINKEGTLNVVDAKNLFDALRPLQAIQLLNLARRNYLSAVLDFNRAQYRLFALIGNPTTAAVAQAGPAPSR